MRRPDKIWTRETCASRGSTRSKDVRVVLIPGTKVHDTPLGADRDRRRRPLDLPSDVLDDCGRPGLAPQPGPAPSSLRQSTRGQLLDSSRDSLPSHARFVVFFDQASDAAIQFRTVCVARWGLCTGRNRGSARGGRWSLPRELNMLGRVRRVRSPPGSQARSLLVLSRCRHDLSDKDLGSASVP